MMDWQAALGIHQLARVNKNWDRRCLVWERYMAELSRLPIGLPAPVEANTKHAYHLFTIEIDQDNTGISRDAFLEKMTQRGIGVGMHYLSLPEHAFYKQSFGWQPEHYPNAARIGRSTVSLPLSPKLTETEASRVIDAVKSTIVECQACTP